MVVIIHIIPNLTYFYDYYFSYNFFKLKSFRVVIELNKLKISSITTNKLNELFSTNSYTKKSYFGKPGRKYHDISTYNNVNL